VNPVALALTRASTIATTRQELYGRFEEEYAAVEFAPDAESVVVGVPADPARRWAAGELCDLDLLLAMDGRQKAVWWMNLPNWDQYRSGLHLARDLYRRGAFLLILHTKNPTIVSHGLRYGCQVTHQLPDGGMLLLGDAAMLRRWLRG
jgi:hypothetical protein